MMMIVEIYLYKFYVICKKRLKETLRMVSKELEIISYVKLSTFSLVY